MFLSSRNSQPSSIYTHSVASTLMGVITSIWGSPEAVPEQPWSWGSKDETGFAMWQNDEWAPQAEASVCAKARGTLLKAW